MKKLLTIIALTLTGLLLVACEDKKPVEPILPEDSTPLVPLEPSTPIEYAEITEDGKHKFNFEATGYSYITLTFNTKDYKEVNLYDLYVKTGSNSYITLYDIELNGEALDLTNQEITTGTSYLGAITLSNVTINNYKFMAATNYEPIAIRIRANKIAEQNKSGNIKVDLTEVSTFKVTIKVFDGNKFDAGFVFI